ncbi:MAG: ATP-binding cassette domain-containing protein [Candidatus Cryptobacteroides sp.]
MDKIIIRNARTNNLRNIDIDIPKHSLVVFSGVSGSGKSSLLFDTIYTEAQRQLVDTFSTFAKTRLPKLSRPDVDEIRNLSTPIVIDQKKMGNNLRSTVGTVTELATYIRLLYSRIGQPFLNIPSFCFSFNHPEGRCPYCHGLGKEMKIDVEKFLDRSKSLRGGAIRHSIYKQNSYMLKELIKYGIFDPDKPLCEWSEEEIDKLLYSEPIELDKSVTGLTYNRFFEGIVTKLERAAVEKGEDELPPEEKKAWAEFFTYRTCPHCGGSRINDRARRVKVLGTGIDELFRMEIRDVLDFMRKVSDPSGISAPILRKVIFVLEQLVRVGVGYLSLERPVSTLSGGESQRVKMAKQLDCDLTDLLYVMDEPSVGLHPRDTENLIGLMKNLKDKGNSVFVVEHDPDIIQAAEWVVDMGPKAGEYGGTVVYNGPVEGLASSEGLTGRFLSQRAASPAELRRPRRWSDFYLVENACANNLKNITVRIPKGVMTCITGVSGCGKSSLVHECFAPQHPDACVIDQQPVGRTTRGNVASYIGIFNYIRQLFADSSAQGVSLFSFNAEGACPKCQGRGYLSFEMHSLDAVQTRCDECGGKRYKPRALAYSYKGMNISEVLDLSVKGALAFFADQSKILRLLRLLDECGLGYLKLGQSLSCLSGGENQRLKIATELKKAGNIYIMDEPTTGLHMSDISGFMDIVDRLVDSGNTVVVIEHNPDVIRRADWVIDLGPEGGRDGGEVLFEGTPEDLRHCEASITGKYI